MAETRGSGEGTSRLPASGERQRTGQAADAAFPSLTFSRGIRDGVPIFIGYLPIALAFGLLAKSVEVPLIHTVGMSLLVFAGASQFMALELIALGTGAAGIVLSTFIVNLRHLLMSMSIHERAEPEGRGRRAAYAFFITDEVFAVASTREGGIRSSYLYGLGIMAYLGWTVNTAVGYLAGSILPATLQEGMGVALYAMFIGLLVPSVKSRRKALYLAAMAALLNSFLVTLMPTGWAIITASAAAVAVMELFETLTGKGTAAPASAGARGRQSGQEAEKEHHDG